jgi:hypothetical protein
MVSDASSDEVTPQLGTSPIEQHILDTNAGKQLSSCHRCLISTGVEKMNII